MIEIKAPNAYEKHDFKIFLAGAIDMGQAVDWQEKVVKALTNFNVTILNPRRDDWDSSWKQEASEPQFNKQVKWELDALEAADLVVYVFPADSKAPITFLEFGLFGIQKPSILCVEKGFYRQGNLDIVAERYNIPVYHTFDGFIRELKKRVWVYAI